ncbi:cytosine permease [Streptomyces sp. HNM0574]|uniref:purine-cytosine permease family protein n=1 Tax=Streptomyces sp. HNM0574 TaxID=2714954 RepID=UPI00146AB795|nr:cytosine permease [Streptomyces sp. HNM0574]NLU67074.1 allantoin permease [Streptomyces sp. HNM0574]
MAEQGGGAAASARGTAVERHGLDVIGDAERTGRPAQLFWPWFGANVSVLGLSYGAFALDFGLSFGQALAAGVAGIVFSFLLCGVIAVAGKRGSAPTMVLSRAAFGVRGNRLPSAVSWLLTVGWETVLVTLATLATATVFDRLGWGGDTSTKLAALVLVSALTVLAGIAGFGLIMRLQAVITVVTGVLTLGYVALVADEIRWATVTALPSGSAQQVLGALVFLMTGFGLGWVNAAADYSRYLPRRTRGAAVAGWTVLGASAAPLLLFVAGLLLAGSSPELRGAVAADPVGALTTLLPLWFLLPFAVVAVLGLVGGAVLDIYSSGLALLAVGVRVPRHAAVAIDGALMIAGTVCMVFLADGFLDAFTGFLTTLGVPVAAWCGIMLADVALRTRPYDEAGLFDRAGRYGDVRRAPVALLAGATAVGWGLVTNSGAAWLTWQGYLLGPLGLGGRSGPWAGANLGVLAALALGLGLTLAFGRARVRAQETAP